MALESVKIKGVSATSIEMQVSIRNLRRWVAQPDAHEKCKPTAEDLEEKGPESIPSDKVFKKEVKVRRPKKAISYSEEFRKEVLKYYEEHGPAKACSKYDINSCLIYTLKKNGVKTKL